MSMSIWDFEKPLVAMMLSHDHIAALEQQIKDLAAHLLEIKQLITPMMEFKQDAVAKADYERGFDDGFILRNEKDGKRTWVGLTDDEKHECYLKSDTWREVIRTAEAILKEKNGG